MSALGTPHDNAFAAGIAKFWREYEVRNGPGVDDEFESFVECVVEHRVGELERTVTDLVASVNALVEWVNARAT